MYQGKWSAIRICSLKTKKFFFNSVLQHQKLNVIESLIKSENQAFKNLNVRYAANLVNFLFLKSVTDMKLRKMIVELMRILKDPVIQLEKA